MIEAAEFATPMQRELYDHYRGIHLKFFPSPPPMQPPQPKAAEPVAIIPAPAPQPTAPIPLNATNLRLKLIRRTVCEFYNITDTAIKSQRRTKDIVGPRHMVSYLAAQFTKASTPHIGRSLGGQDHTTIIHAIRRTKLRIRTDSKIAEDAIRLCARLCQQFGETDRPRNCIGRYVLHERVADHFMLGWMWAANMNECAALMIWPCGCECVEPKE